MKLKHLYAIFTLLLILSTSDINAFTQNNLDKKITLKVSELEIKKVLAFIEQQTQASFAYNSRLSTFNNKVSFQVEDKTLAYVLDQILRDTDISYTLSGDMIVLFKKKAAATGDNNTGGNNISSLNNNKNTVMPPPVNITGKVQDENGNGLSGVSIILKGSSLGTTTNASGNYSFRLPSDNGILIFSFIGYDVQEIPVNNQSVINVVMAQETKALNEVVVVGYGTQRRANLTGAISTVNFSDLENIPQSNTLNILQGRIPGISIVQPGGAPGRDGGEVNIRGIGTLNDASPLVIIDGVPSTLADFGNLTPQEVGDVTVLKDASSAAIYGARGANGVILVTTKQPKEGKMKINFNSYYSLQSPTYIQDFVQSWQWMELNNEATDIMRYPQFAIDNLRNGIVTDTFHNTRWMNEILRTAPMTNYNLSLSGGTKNVSFQSSFGLLRQEGILLGTSSDRYNFRSNVNARINPKLETGINLWGYMRKIKEPFESPDFIIQRATSTWPVIPVKYANGSWGVDYLYPGLNVATQNPVLLTELGNTNEDQGKANIQTFLQFLLTKDLKIRTSLTYTYGKESFEKFNPTYSFPNPAGTPTFVNNLNELINQTSESLQLQLQTLVTYNKTLNKVHNISVLGGHEYTDFKSRFFRASGNDLPTNDQRVLSRALSNIAVAGSKQEWALQSFFGRFNYAFANKYLLEGNFRVDGSSRFPEDNRYGFFPSFSAGWVLSEEKFFNGLINNKAILSQLKLRGGWGRVGNDRIGNYTYNQQLNTGYYNYGGTIQTSAAINNFANPAIRWESTSTTNLGIDASFLRNRLMFSFDVFDRLTDGILYRLPLPSSFGNVQPAIMNIGKVANNGWELNIEHRNRVGKLNYNAGFNVAYVKNKIEKLNTREAVSDRFILREGEAINSYYGYVYEGLFRDSSDIGKYPKFSNNGFQIGTMRFKDVNGDGKITPDDRVVLGSANTPITFGLNGGLKAVGFDLNFLLQGVKDKFIYVYDNGNRPGNAANSNFWKEWWDNRFDIQNNPNGTWPVLKRTSPEAAQTSGFWLQDASYIRLKNIEVGYNIPAEALRKIHFSNFRFYVAGQNIATFSKLIKQVDPERSASRTDNQSYPQVKSVTVGFNATF